MWYVVGVVVILVLVVAGMAIPGEEPYAEYERSHIPALDRMYGGQRAGKTAYHHQDIVDLCRGIEQDVKDGRRDKAHDAMWAMVNSWGESKVGCCTRHPWLKQWMALWADGQYLAAQALKEASMKGDYSGRATTTPVVQKACHACGQRLPIQVGNIVEGRKGTTTERGTVIAISPMWADIVAFDGKRHTLYAKGLTRLHGYYRITSRESMA